MTGTKGDLPALICELPHSVIVVWGLAQPELLVPITLLSPGIADPPAPPQMMLCNNGQPNQSPVNL